MDTTTTVRVSGIGKVRAQRHGTAVLVYIGDVLHGIGRKTPGKASAQRTPARIRATAVDGNRQLHMIDVAAAIAMVGAARGLDERVRLQAIQGMLDMYAQNFGKDTIPESAKPRRHGVTGAGPRPPGTTVAEMMRVLGRTQGVDPRQAAKFVSDRYTGNRSYHPDGVVFEDREQVAELVSAYADGRIGPDL